MTSTLDLTVTVLVTEIACASGRPPLGCLLPPVILATDDAVTIAFAVRKLPGGQDCPAKPETRVDVQLTEPLGNRGLFGLERASRGAPQLTARTLRLAAEGPPPPAQPASR